MNCVAAPEKKGRATTAEPSSFPSLNIKLKHYDWVVLNSSGGKDSQTMMRKMVQMAEKQNYPLDRLVVVHCDLGPRVEWDGTRELAEEQARHYGLRFEAVSRPQGDILDEVRQRAVAIWSKAVRERGETPVEDFARLRAQAERLTNNVLPSPFPSNDNRWCTSHHKTNQVSTLLTRLASPWPSDGARWCTSDQKRGQVARVLTQLADETPARRKVVRWKEIRKKDKATGKFVRTGEFKRVLVPTPVRILNCMGMRAAESPARSKLRPFKLDRAQTNDRRTVHVLLPIFDWSADQVWADIKESGVRHHKAYDLGMGRLSCCFCIYAPKNALMLAGKHNPQKLAEYVEVEKQVGSRFRVELSLLEVKEALDRGEEPGTCSSWEMP